MGMRPEVVESENLEYLRGVPSGSVDLIYIDPPFNTGRRREGSAGQYGDSQVDYLGFMEPRLREGHRVLRPEGSFFLHADYREVHYLKVLMDEIFGRENFRNEIIWAYDYGGRSKTRWPAKHDNILWYSKSPSGFTFNYAQIDRIPYMAPGLVGKEKAARGKTPTDVWWHTIVPTNGKEKTGYPTQKPLGVLERIVRIHSRPGDLVVDFFAGSGTTGEACRRHGRRCVLVDHNPEAIRVMHERFGLDSRPDG